MMAKSSKLQEWLDNNPSLMSEALTAMKDDREEVRYVEGINGDKLLVKDVVRDTHTDVREIKQTITPLKDFATLHKIMRKYRLYWVVAPTAVVTFVTLALYAMYQILKSIG